jgi:hypothetical protein
VIALIGDEAGGVYGWSKLTNIVAGADLKVPQGTLGVMVSRFASVRGYYYDTVLITNTEQSFTCLEQQIWRLRDLDQAKAVYREADAVAMNQKKDHFGDKRRAKAAVNR